MAKDCIIFDIDGTLADISHRLHHIKGGGRKDYDAFFDAMVDDAAHEPVCWLAAIIGDHLHSEKNHTWPNEDGTVETSYEVFLCSGRPETHREQTLRWLVFHVPSLMRHEPTLLMRAEGDYRRDTVVKREMLGSIRGQGYEPLLVIDDRQSVVDMWREEGITTLQCLPNWEEPKVAAVPGKLTLMVGPSGAGKSSLVRKLWPDGQCVVSSDRIREELCGDFRDQSKNDQVFAALHAVVETRIRHGLDTVVDATNLRRKDRRSITSRVPESCRIEYRVVDRPLEDKHACAGWREHVVVGGDSLIDFHHQRFQNALGDIMRGDDDPRVRVHDHRIY